MKRFFAAILMLLVVFLGGSKVALVIGASKLLSHAKTELVSVGALNYQSISTSLQDSEIVISNPTFKHFVLKKDFSAEQVRIKFDGNFDLMLGLVSALRSDYSALDQLIFDDFKTELPDQALYEALSDGLSPSIDLWFAFLTCDGQSSPTKTSFSKAGIEDPKAQVTVRFGLPDSTLEFDTSDFGRVIIEMDLLGQISGSGNGRINTVSYIDNGYFKRLAQTCDVVPTDPESLSQGIINGWSNSLAAFDYRLSSSALSVVKDYIEQGGILRFSAGAATPAPREGVFGWQDAEFVADIDLQANDGETVALNLQQYIEPPVQEVVSESAQKAEPAYAEISIATEADLSPLEQLLGQQVRVSLFKGQQHEGSVKLIDQNQIEVIPLNGDGKVSYTFRLSEIEKLEVWVE